MRPVMLDQTESQVPRKRSNSGYRRLQARERAQRAEYEAVIQYLREEIARLRESADLPPAEIDKMLEEHAAKALRNGWGAAALLTMDELEAYPDVRSVQVIAAVLAQLQLKLASIAQMLPL
jgi:hypothetical protein